MNNQNLKTLPSQTDEIASPNAFRGSIAERRAAKCGFNADRINTARFRTTTSLTVPSPAAVRSPCITIPPGISPTALLDSPILLPNSQPSPTTGTFLIPDHGSSLLNSVTPSEQERGNNVSSSFRFKPHGDPSPLLIFPPLDNQGNSDLQVLVPVEQSMDFEFPAEFSKEATVGSCTGDSITDVNLQNSMIFSANFGGMQMCCLDVASNQSSVQRDPINGDKAGIHDAVEENKVTFPATANGRTSEDGYNWRKYGQKQVKGSEYPRSYYKCTHPTCQVKKKIERSHDGQITEIIYKGAHNHLKPQPSRRVQLGSGSSFGEMPEKDEGSGTCVRVEHGSLWRNTELESKDIKHSSEWRADGMERTSSTSVVTELSDPLSTTQGKSVGTFESAETPELSSTLASHDDDDEDEKATQGSISLRADYDESESKRRKVESYMVETNLASRAIREPRVVVQIESEIDILDDGYRWRKYGQKVVKGNPNPRSYYKCTSAGCSVRKHVERASHNLKYVITTYEGKHNHEVPAARNSTNVNSSSNILSQATANAQPSLALARNCGPKLETQLQDFTPGFDRKPIFHNDYLGARFPVNFTGEVKLGTSSSIYPLKYPSIQRAVSYGSYGFDSNHSATHLSGSAASLVPDFQISLPLSLPTTANHSLAGVGFSNNGSLIGQVQTFLSGQQFIRPKEEQKDDHLYDSGLSIINHANPSSSSTSLYHHIRGNFPS